MVGRSDVPVILFIDPDGVDTPVAEEALRARGLRRCTLITAEGLEDAERALSGGILADVIFLRLNGDEDEISSLKQIERLRSYKSEEHTPIVVFADRHDPEFVDRVYEFPMTCYIRRVGTREDYLRALRNAFDFWCLTAVLPRRDRTWQAI